jgi:hypothetical protein
LEPAVNFETIDEGHYVGVVEDLGVEFDVDRLRRERHELFGELAVSASFAGARSHGARLSIGTFNLSSPRARQERAKQLTERARTNGKIDWLGLLEEFCQRVFDAERAGRPAVLLRDLPRPHAADALDVQGLRLFRDHPVIWFGDGGASKSYLALFTAGCLAQAGLTVLLADWELCGDDHRDRLERIFGPNEMPPVLYARCDRPMVYEADRLGRLVQQHRVSFLICDSIAFACDGPPEAAEVASRYFQAVRRIGIGSLHLAHTNRSERADEKPFGSTFWHNGARGTWHVKPSESGMRDRLVVGLFNKKSNLGPLCPAVGFEILFDANRTAFARIELMDVGDLAAELPLWQRIAQTLKGGPRTLAEIAGALDAKVDTVEKAVKRKASVFERISGVDGVARVTLIRRNAS